MYEPPRDNERPGCLETLVLTRAIFAILLLPFLALVGLLVLIVVSIALFALHPALIVLPVAAAAVGIYLLARWERRRRPPAEM